MFYFFEFTKNNKSLWSQIRENIKEDVLLGILLLPKKMIDSFLGRTIKFFLQLSTAHGRFFFKSW